MGGQVVHIVRSPAATERALFVYVTVGPRQGVFAVDSQSATDQPTSSAVAANASVPAASDAASGGDDMPRKKKWNVMRVSIKVRKQPNQPTQITHLPWRICDGDGDGDGDGTADCAVFVYLCLAHWLDGSLTRCPPPLFPPPPPPPPTTTTTSRDSTELQELAAHHLNGLPHQRYGGRGDFGEHRGWRSRRHELERPPGLPERREALRAVRQVAHLPLRAFPEPLESCDGAHRAASRSGLDHHLGHFHGPR